MAYIPPCKRKNANNSNFSSSVAPKQEHVQNHVQFEPPEPTPPRPHQRGFKPNGSPYSYDTRKHDSDYQEYDPEDKRYILELENQVRELKFNISTMRQKINDQSIDLQHKDAQIEQLQKQLNLYTSKGIKISKEDYDELNSRFEKYKQDKYEEFKVKNAKIAAHDEDIRKLNSEIRNIEEKLRLNEQQLHQYKTSVKDLNERLKEARKSQVIKASVEPKPAPQQELPKLEDEHLIQDDWNGIIQSIDYILSLDKKAIPKHINIPALKLTRQLLNSHQ